ncbi:hypothetical protein BCD67_19285 [Oscillatoriales cyanobacterium USR001]|nr:hypothetical protein BCD67_19285 [Oscillatoriales cyanobacterium USR001]
MSLETIESIEERLLQVFAQLPENRQKQLLNFAVSLCQQELAKKWDALSEEEAAAFKAEFADEDIALAEATLTDYLPMLQREDEA